MADDDDDDGEEEKQLIDLLCSAAGKNVRKGKKNFWRLGWFGWVG